MNGTKMSEIENQSEETKNGTINTAVNNNSKDHVIETPFRRNLDDPRRCSRASLRQIPRRVSTATIKSRGGWGNKWGKSIISFLYFLIFYIISQTLINFFFDIRIFVKLCWAQCWYWKCLEV